MRKLATVPLLQVILGIVAASLTIGAERPGPGRDPLTRQHLSFQIASSTPAAAALVERWIDVDRPHREHVRAAAVWPEGSGAAPIVVVLHGSEGFNQDHVHLAEAFARAGFFAVAGCWFASDQCPRGATFSGATLDATHEVRRPGPALG